MNQKRWTKIKRVFLGWQKPFLQNLAAHLLDHYTRGGLLDLSGVIVAFPGARAGRRLLELLAESAAFIPPRIVTAGELPELLYQPQRPLADDLTVLLAWNAALRAVPKDVLAALVPVSPEPGDISAWLDLAGELAALKNTLSSDRVPVSEVAPRCLSAFPNFPEEDRWTAITRIHKEYLTVLKRTGFTDIHEARFEACRSTPVLHHEILLAGITDLNGVTRRLLADATSFVHAPESMSGMFDEFGCPIVDEWRTRTIELATSQIRVTGRPHEQAFAVLEAMRRDPPLCAEEITIGLGDEESADHLVRALSLRGIPARPPAICTLAQTSPWLLLSEVARYSDAGSEESLLRHPDMPRSGFRETMKPFSGSALLSEWAPRIMRFLGSIYGNTASDRRLTDALTQIAKASLMMADAALPLSVSFSEAMDILRRLLGKAVIASEGGEAAVEMLGWLELPLDDAPHLIITGFNEHLIPQSITSDPFLPDSICSRLGLTDNQRRFARDAYLLTALVASRTVTLVCSRCDAAGNPLMPSRLLLACEDALLPERLALFYGDHDSSAAVAMLQTGDKNELTIPPPRPEQPLEILRVTAFRDYIACPYRFYLKHVLRLETARARSEEWDSSEFGTVAHSALRIFGEREAAASNPSTDAGEIHSFLCEALDVEVTREFGARLPAAILIQKQILKDRFHAFSIIQAAHAGEGWKIIEVERKFETQLEVDGTPFTITGHIDRIDRQDERLMIIDYKTGARKTPEQRHRRGPKNEKKWVDLQLPLYRVLARDNGFPSTDLAFICIGNKRDEIALEPAKWTSEDLAGAEELAAGIIRDIRDGRFWPPSDPPINDDGFGPLCMDTAIDRSEIIARTTP